MPATTTNAPPSAIAQNSPCRLPGTRCRRIVAAVVLRYTPTMVRRVEVFERSGCGRFASDEWEDPSVDSAIQQWSPEDDVVAWLRYHGDSSRRTPALREGSRVVCLVPYADTHDLPIFDHCVVLTATDTGWTDRAGNRFDFFDVAAWVREDVFLRKWGA